MPYNKKWSQTEEGKRHNRENTARYLKTPKGIATMARYKQSGKKKITIQKNRLKKRYGISIDDYNDLYNQQNGCCAICGIHQSQLSSALGVDHCHTTKIIRGLLCHRCNLALGLVKNDIDILKKMINYLLKSRNN